ncbi:MAG: DNA repair protein RadA [Nitrospirota bacterium]|nr:DNA repair protein RadA [Nitrospirota bacterium]
MAKLHTTYTCQKCGYASPKWLGRCTDCGGWNTFVEERTQGSAGRSKGGFSGEASRPVAVSEITGANEARFSSGMSELDRVLGGGTVAGSVVLIGGDPGIGKSTLMIQASHALSGNAGKVLYVSGEESPRQIKMRCQRLGIDSESLFIMAETSLEGIMQGLKEIKPGAIVVDSIQTVFSQELDSAPGSVSQVREAGSRITMHAKQAGVTAFLIGHVTKDGAIAGPRVLEHMVDTVLYFEGGKGHSYRILRAVKNRFGSSNEIGVFEMREEGLREVANPSELFLAERPADATGSVVVASMEGTRPILVELQALISPTTFGTPRRATIGVDHNRVSLLLAVLEKRAGLHLMGHDVFVNIVGGLRLDEPATDLGIVAAVASSFLDVPIPADTVVLGEVGLAGEVRAVSQAEARVREAAKLGFKRCVLPARSGDKLPKVKGMELVTVDTLQRLREVLF